MADLELTSASLATREAIADLLPIPSAYGKLYYVGSQSLSVTTAGVQVVGFTKGTDDNLVLNDNDIEILYQADIRSLLWYLLPMAIISLLIWRSEKTEQTCVYVIRSWKWYQEGKPLSVLLKLPTW